MHAQALVRVCVCVYALRGGLGHGHGAFTLTADVGIGARGPRSVILVLPINIVGQTNPATAG